MEILDIVFTDVSNIISECCKKGSVAGEEPQDINSNAEFSSLDKLERFLFPQNAGLDDNEVEDINYEKVNSCVLMTKEKLLSLNSTDNRNSFAKIFAKEFDARISNSFSGMEFVCSLGYKTRYLTRCLNDLIEEIVSSFAIFDIDLIPLLQEESDFEGILGTYNRFRSEKFNKNSKKNSESHKQKKSTNKDNGDDGISNYIKINNESLKESNRKDNETLIDYFYNNNAIMEKFLLYTKGKTGKPVAIEIKALCELGKIDFSNMSAFLRSIGIDKKKEDAITRCFRSSSKYYLDSHDQYVIAAKQHYE